MTEYHKSFTAAQLQSLDIAARVTACLSLTGSSFTIISFLSYAPLRKPVNRLAFSIAVSNIFGCLAYSWGRHPIAAGRHSAWCQTQGLFITWFVMTDPILVRRSSRSRDRKSILMANHIIGHGSCVQCLANCAYKSKCKPAEEHRLIWDMLCIHCTIYTGISLSLLETRRQDGVWGCHFMVLDCPGKGHSSLGGILRSCMVGCKWSLLDVEVMIC